MERSSSQTRILARDLPWAAAACSCGALASVVRRCYGRRNAVVRRSASNRRSRITKVVPARLGSCPHLALVSLHNLVDHGKPGLYRLRSLTGRVRKFFSLLRSHACSGVAETNLPVITVAFECDLRVPPSGMARTAFSPKFQKTCLIDAIARAQASRTAKRLSMSCFFSPSCGAASE